MTAATVPPSVADWLKATALYAVATDPDAAAWGDSATETEIVSPFALATDGAAEAARQLAFLGGGPLAIDEHVVAGQQAGLVGLPVNLTGDRLGYEQSDIVLVIGAVEGDGITTLTVVKRM